jgi:RNA polymerase sigma factor (sigma-70 family)
MAQRFDSTIWTTIWRARNKDPKALNEFVERYKVPILHFIQRHGVPSNDAEELTQEVFLRIFKDNVLGRADRDRGRFRNLLLTLTRNVIKDDLRRRNAMKRGGHRVILSLDHAAQDEMRLGDSVGEQASEEEFDRLWVRNILKLALDKLRKENETYFTAFTLLLDEMDYKTIADRMSKSVKDIDNYIYRSKQKLIRYIQGEIAGYSSSTEEYQDEIRYLSRYITAATERKK